MQSMKWPAFQSVNRIRGLLEGGVAWYLIDQSWSSRFRSSVRFECSCFMTCTCSNKENSFAHLILKGGSCEHVFIIPNKSSRNHDRSWTFFPLWFLRLCPLLRWLPFSSSPEEPRSICDGGIVWLRSSRICWFYLIRFG